MSENQTPFAETEALIAVMNDDDELAYEILGELLPGELAELRRHARELADKCADVVRTKARQSVGLSDALTKANREDGRRERYLIYSLDLVEDDELYDWGTREPGADRQPWLYVHEFAARNCCPPGHEVVKRRLGTTDWIPAPEEER